MYHNKIYIILRDQQIYYIKEALLIEKNIAQNVFMTDIYITSKLIWFCLKTSSQETVRSLYFFSSQSYVYMNKQTSR